MAEIRKKLIAGNWKMNLQRDDAYALMAGLRNEAESLGDEDVLICPPFPYLEIAVQMMKDRAVHVGAQNLYHAQNGPFTGEVSAPMLKSIGCSHAIIGHSERRTIFTECNTLINKKVASCLACGMIPILCVGETLDQRNRDQTFDVLSEQLTYGLQGIDGASLAATVIAYEPVWAIGTGVSAGIDQVEEVHGFIREVVARFSDGETAQTVRIIYGGSVNPTNALELLSCNNVDGALIGGASLKLDSFCGIVQASIASRERNTSISQG
jgi:triosephosphate isomerase